MTLTLWAFHYLIDKKYIRFFLFIIIGRIFHVSSLIFVFAFFIVIMRKSKWFYWILSIIFAFCTVNYSLIFDKLLQLLDYGHYNEYLELEGGYSATTFVVQLVILIISILFIKRYKNENEDESRVFIGITCLGVITQLFAFIVASAFRISMYFSVFSIILLPNCLSMIEDVRLRRLLKIGVVMIFIFFFVYTNRNGSSVVPYKFFWTN